MVRVVAPAEVIRRLQAVADAVDEGCSRTATAAKLDLTPAGLIAFLARYDLRGWPVDPAEVRKWAASVDAGATIEIRPSRGSLGVRKVGETAVLTQDVVAKRREEAERARVEREAYWLEQERAKYGLPRRGRPLSGQVA